MLCLHIDTLFYFHVSTADFELNCGSVVFEFPTKHVIWITVPSIFYP